MKQAVLGFCIFMFCTGNAYATTARMTPNGSTSTQGIWTPPPLYSYIDDPAINPAVPDTSAPISIGVSASDPVDTIIVDLDAPGSVQTATSFTVNIYAKSQDRGKGTNTLRVGYGSGGVPGNWGADMPLTTSYAWYTFTYSSLSLTQSDVNALQVCFLSDIIQPLATITYMAALYVDITYSSAGAEPKVKRFGGGHIGGGRF